MSVRGGSCGPKLVWTIATTHQLSTTSTRTPPTTIPDAWRHGMTEDPRRQDMMDSRAPIKSSSNLNGTHTEEADALTNEDFRGFAPGRRLQFDIKKLIFLFSPD